MKRSCRCCGVLFRPRCSGQCYCSKPECQRWRKNHWQRKKMASDPAYRANQADAQKLWRKKNPHYMRTYRKSHPEYVSRNRELQKQRSAKTPDPFSGISGGVVKMDTGNCQPPVISGRYRLVPMDVVKMDVITVQLSILEGVS